MKDAFSDGNFLTGLVFGFDVGTGSIGYAVRKGTEFKDVGVIICPEDTNDLSGRRGLRRQRRTLRSRKYRRQWFANELAKLGLANPTQPFNDPISLRLRALNGDELKPEELHAALAHLFKRRGYQSRADTIQVFLACKTVWKELISPAMLTDQAALKILKSKERVNARNPIEITDAELKALESLR